MVTSVSNTSATNSSATSSTSSTNGLATTYETFLGLLTAQIKNQDPLSPMDSTQWTNQLVQYTSVEQQLKANEYLKSLVGLGAGNMASSVNMIGKTAIADIDTQTFKDKPLTWHYELASTASQVGVEVLDADGKTVWKGTSDQLNKGDNTFTWDGKDSTGNTVKEGDYTLKVTATSASGSAIANAISVQQRVDATELIDGEIVLRMGNSLIAMSAITGVRETADA
ncbi:flagellar hook assembly protein FlgD [Asticcacaulis excentricus]|uniref:Basal-body rod modification protein FlgD n=1 Tax=Asticcacaulis excentricus (strain ATCC 15261 / DSM 4724 / KCTC 12464 / NCIMB 9791 / VKM B-1370 / CB 48) TaxID=573065 RepID=E8RR86_ASTEC|nr:flagellar hook capping FlgD N-terminal domain-containing protein [Asticcacaulis excentricus]ADU12277.1 flagellar hook capping protein [Asticcacaulis excentricus CB 48]